MNEINKRITYITSIIVIDWQIKKVKFDFEIFIKLF